MVIGAYFITQYVRPWPSYSIGGVPQQPNIARMNHIGPWLPTLETKIN